MHQRPILAILAPSEKIWHGTDFVAVIPGEGDGETVARQMLLTNFASTVLGPSFANIDPNDVQQLWRLAEKNGFKMMRFESASAALVS